jgi:arylsulfatase A-like enzyme
LAIGICLLALPATCLAQPAAPATAPVPPPVVIPTVAPPVQVASPYVLIVSIDGCRPDVMLLADTPTIRSLMKRGSYTMWARTTDVAVTIPSHVSMMTGVPPEVHGINFNSDPPDNAQIAVPTLFDLAKAKGLSTAMASGKRKFTLFLKSGHVDESWVTNDPVCRNAPVAEQAERLVAKFRPRLLYVHLPESDTAGHGKGWGTADQVAALEAADRAIKRVLDAYDREGLTDQLFVIVSADHGGTARSHGKDDPRSRYIPWILAGPGVRAGYDLTRLGKDYEVATYDTFATACHLLGLTPPAGITGKVVAPAFDAGELLTPVK